MLEITDNSRWLRMTDTRRQKRSHPLLDKGCSEYSADNKHIAIPEDCSIGLQKKTTEDCPVVPPYSIPIVLPHPHLVPNSQVCRHQAGSLVKDFVAIVAFGKDAVQDGGPVLGDVKSKTVVLIGCHLIEEESITACDRSCEDAVVGVVGVADVIDGFVEDDGLEMSEGNAVVRCILIGGDPGAEAHCTETRTEYV